LTPLQCNIYKASIEKYEDEGKGILRFFIL